ncbi:unnamed protein product [Lactuca virosa]|uniref:Uncharacterized protein n=1 Tax=Lactuca virosa TaxID=75947 RepID=A0AAU9M9F4_9ASTR|nr:unnamed protein product [Lactuca virosa]
MAERKVLNKYYPPDFDPAKIPRMPKNQQMKVRMMLPMSIRCTLAATIFTEAQTEITIKTDSQNSDYVVESGATRNYEHWRAEDEVKEEQRRRDAKEIGDPMKSSENRRIDSNRHMKILSALDEIKSMNSRHANLTLDAILEALQRSSPLQQEDKLQEEDQTLIKSIFHGSRKFKKRRVSESLTNYLTKTSIDHDTLNKREDRRGLRSFVFKSSAVKFSVVKKPLEAGSAKTQANEKEQEDDKAKNTSNALGSLCQQYDNDDDEE